MRRGTTGTALRPQIGAACRDDRVCVALCPEQALIGFAIEARQGVALRLADCNGCGRCVAACPERAIALVPSEGRREGILPLTAHRPLVCAHCLEPYVGAPDDVLCPGCTKDLGLFRGAGPKPSARPVPAIEEGEES